MDLFTIAMLFTIAIGFVLVLGGLWLIASGAVKLTGDKQGNATLKVGELFQMGTTVPGLGIFVVGLAFRIPWPVLR